MADSFLHKLFGRKKRSTEERDLDLSGAMKRLVQPGTPSSDSASQKDSKPHESATAQKTVGFKVRLFAFVDPKDPFAAGEIAGEELPGPILSLMNARHFDSVVLFCTPQTRENASMTERELSRRYPKCPVSVFKLPISDPKNYLSLMGVLAPVVRKLLGDPVVRPAVKNYVCVSSGTAEMRVTWFLLNALGVLPAKLVQVELPAGHQLGEANVRDVRMEAGDWETVRESAVRGGNVRTTLALGLQGRFSGVMEGDQEFVERMRMLYGDPLTNLLPGLRRKFLSRSLPPHSVRALEEETFSRVAAVLGAGQVGQGEILIDSSQVKAFLKARRAALQPDSFAALVNSICDDILLEYGQALPESQRAGESDYEVPDVLNEFRLTPSQLEALRRRLPRLEVALQASPRAGKEESVSSKSKFLETFESQIETTEEAPTQEPPREEPPAGAKDKAVFLGGRERPESRNATARESPGEAADEGIEEVIDAEGGTTVPGLDDALQELGIYVGSAVLRHAAERAGIAAGSDLPVLLLGETGTGKERFAHLIHRMSPRRSRELVAINCAAIPESLAESYLFGHIKGAFSGAASDKKGMFESADLGTLFLDEIAELTLEVQAKLLRVIQDGVVQRLGSTVPRKVDVRVIAATNRNLRDQVAAGRFREDLYFRLEVVEIKLPPLRERRSEIPELALALLRQINLRRHKPRQLSSAALMRLERYDWPGNVRQLSNVLERSVLYARHDGIDADELLITDDRPSKDPFTALPEPVPGFEIKAYLTQVREQLFLRALAACKGNQTEAAKLLGLSKEAVSKFVAGRDDNEN